MAANLTPQYLDAEEAYRRAQTPEERLACLQKMWTLLPKHKASEKLQAELKTKISATKKELEKELTSPKKGGVSYKIPRQGAGQILLLGAPNAGKSAFLAKVTRAKPEVAAFPFSTREPLAGMMDWEDVRIQLIDMPPITKDFFEPYVSDMLQVGDAVALFVDLANDDAPFETEAVLDQLASVKKRLVRAEPEEPDDWTICYRKTLLVANKCDAPDADARLEIVREMFAEPFPIEVVSVERGDGLEALRTALYQLLGVMRVYTKLPGKPADRTSPYTCPIGSSVEVLAGKIHQDFIEKLKSARVWGTGVHDGQTVKRDHILHDKDVVELHL